MDIFFIRLNSDYYMIKVQTTGFDHFGLSVTQPFRSPLYGINYDPKNINIVSAREYGISPKMGEY
jgi:hypothetical protein